jgi:hypothetical protein
MDQQLSLEKPVGNFNKITFGVGEAQLIRAGKNSEKSPEPR